MSLMLRPQLQRDRVSETPRTTSASKKERFRVGDFNMLEREILGRLRS